MTSTVDIPLWLAICGGALALVAILDRLLIPSVRWYMRKRLARVIDEVNARLELKIQPFKLTRRAVLIDRLVHDPEVMEAVFEHARTEAVPFDLAAARALSYARETVPSFSAFAYFSLGTRLARLLSQALFRVRVGRSEDGAAGTLDDSATVVFVLNHRSNMDYILVTYLAAERSALSYAVGEWARVWPLQMLIRSMGAYFIRRKSRNPLYRKVLARYVQMATGGGVTQAVFPEGGLSRDGALGPPKLGILSYILDDFDPERSRDVVFVPIGLNYDRVLEDRLLIAAAGDPKARFNVGIIRGAGFVARHLWLRLSGRFHRYGYACVSFGAPVSLRDWLTRTPPGTEAACDPVAALGAELLHRIGALIPVLPVPLVAAVLLDHGAMTRADLTRAAEARLDRLRAAGAYYHLPRGDAAYALDVGVRALTERRILTERDGLLTPAPGQEAILRYYAASIAHHDAPKHPGAALAPSDRPRAAD